MEDIGVGQGRVSDEVRLQRLPIEATGERFGVARDTERVRAAVEDESNSGRSIHGRLVVDFGGRPRFIVLGDPP